MSDIETSDITMSDELTKLLWYKSPAENWHEALPIGNGRLGAMIYGGANKDLITFNEDSIWDGRPLDKLNARGLEALPIIRKMIFEGKLKEAMVLAEATMVSQPKDPFSYQPLCDLTVENRTSRKYSEYRRQLDLRTAIASVNYVMDGDGYTKEYFSSAADQVAALRYTSTGSRYFNLIAGITRQVNFSYDVLDDSTVLVKGFGDERGIHFAGVLKIVTEPGDGKSEAIRGAYAEEGRAVFHIYAKTVTFYLAAATTFRTSDPAAAAGETVEKAAAKGWDALKKNHIADYQKLFNRFDLHLEGGAAASEKLASLDLPGLDTAERLELVRGGLEDPDFFTLYSNYNRYLLISDSRPGSLPTNLQGIWNHRIHAPWESDFHTNVNFQINYWPVETYNLAECHRPVFDWLERMVEHGADTAKRLYGARGWVLHHCTDIWGVSSPIYHLIGIWPMGALWCCRDFYEYYLHNLDTGLIRDRGYTVLKGAVEFMLDFLIEAPVNTPWAGYLVTNPSHSPENHYVAEDGSKADFTWAATLDIELITDMFGICVEFIDLVAKEQPGFEAEFKKTLQDTIKRLPPVQISGKTGGIQEWIYDYDEVEPGHRHVSHLYAVYPGTQITAEKTPELAAAAAKTLYRRYANGYDSQGWSMGWIANIWARLGNAGEVYNSLLDVTRKHILYNLFINAHGNPQVGDMQASGAAIMEAIAQSHDGKIRLLPALPAAWPRGSVRGFKLRGGHELEMKWDGGKLTWARITSVPGSVDMPIVFADSGAYTIAREGNARVITPK
jgi:alpha-L-fucosidase 2